MKAPEGSVAAKRRWRRFAITCAALIVLIFCSWSVWMLSFSAEQFQNAMRLGQTARAETLWKLGDRAKPGDPYGDLMRIIDRLQENRGVRVTEWKVGKLQTINGFYALLDINAPEAVMGLGLSWEKGKWLLKTDMTGLPPYVKQSIALDGRSEG